MKKFLLKIICALVAIALVFYLVVLISAWI